MDQLADTLITENQDLISLAVALALGALIGLQRGWSTREQTSGERVAGIRTHALIGLLGGLSVLVGRELGPWVPALLLVLVALAGLAGYYNRTREVRDFSITGWVGLVLTFIFGVLVLAGYLVVAASAAVVTAIILDNKKEIHGFVRTLQAHELDAGLRLLLISVVLLPILPNEGYGPNGVLNPREIWWLVVLIAAIGFVGYFAMRLGGAAKGILFTSLFAGLSSSTALTLHFSRLSRNSQELSPLLASGILIACGTMFPRILLYAALIHPPLLPALFPPVLVMGVLLYGAAVWIWRRQPHSGAVGQPENPHNPLELRSALMFGGLLVLILLLGEWFKLWFGDAGVYLLSAASGMADVNAITLSLTRMAREDLIMDVAVLAIVIAASVNNMVKAGLALGIGGERVGRQVLFPMLLSLLAGLGVALVA